MHYHARFGQQRGRSIFSLVLRAGQASCRTSVEFVSENKRQWWKCCLYLFLHHTCNTASQATRFDLLVFYIKLSPFEVKAFELGKNCCSCCLPKLPSFRVSVAVDRVVSIDCCRSYYPQTYRVSFRFFFLYFYVWRKVLFLRLGRIHHVHHSFPTWRERTVTTVLLSFFPVRVIDPSGCLGIF